MSKSPISDSAIIIRLATQDIAELRRAILFDRDKFAEIAPLVNCSAHHLPMDGSAGACDCKPLGGILRTTKWARERVDHVRIWVKRYPEVFIMMDAGYRIAEALNCDHRHKLSEFCSDCT